MAPRRRERIDIACLKGCDVAPVDLTDPAQALRLKAYIWPEHTVRFDRMEAAIAAAKEHAPELVRMNAADFVEAELEKPQADGHHACSDALDRLAIRAKGPAGARDRRDGGGGRAGDAQTRRSRGSRSKPTARYRSTN